MVISNKKERYKAIGKAIGWLVACCVISSLITFQMLKSKYLQINLNEDSYNQLLQNHNDVLEENAKLESEIASFDSVINQIYLVDSEVEKTGLTNTEKTSLETRVKEDLNSLSLSLDNVSNSNIKLALGGVLRRMEILINSKNKYKSQLIICEGEASKESGIACQAEKDKLREIKSRIRSITGRVHNLDWCNGPGGGRQETKDELVNLLENALR